ncbi:hypothetical protein Rmf_49030 [Roseomonas fluvialis]|uniref:Heparinase II/III-like C-terminal domain-containing protein n=1 Tax=Roseomonas fluvialis TaxID=1750527 RepID=A0ABM7YAF2_9PROT|nr:hypothetical protein Rmf_49030 [Roseomonas fluvialis]
MADAAWRLGPRAVALFAWHRARMRLGLARRALPDAPVAPRAASPWHGPFDGAAHALDLDLFAPGDIRPVWEANRLGALVAPGAATTDALLADWIAANPPFRGPAWACGQEAALRALHLCLFGALHGPDRVPRAVLAAHAQRIAATRAYAAAQDNNHAVSEPAGLFVLGLVLDDAAMARRGARDLARAVARLVTPDGAFAQASPGYHRLLLDTIAVAEWFRRRHGAPGFAAPFTQRARAATVWLHRVASEGGALPRAGACDDSALADLSGAGPADARGSLERAARLFCDASAGHPDDFGCGMLGIPCPDAVLPRGGAWRSAGWRGETRGALSVLLRSGAPLRFRPAQADLLHLDFRIGETVLLRDGGTGSYNPPPGGTWWIEALAGTAGHNTIAFDGEDQMPRVSRFLFARWPRCRTLPDGAVLRDWRGRRHARRFTLDDRRLTVRDEVGGTFAALTLRWRLAPGDWRLTATGVDGPAARIAIAADGPLRLRLAQGWESPAYGVVVPAPVLEATARSLVSRLTTVVDLT